MQNTQTGMTVEEVRGSLDSTDNGTVKNFVTVMGQQMRLENSEKIQIHRKKLERNQKRRRRPCSKKLKYRTDSMRTSSFSSRRPTSMTASASSLWMCS